MTDSPCRFLSLVHDWLEGIGDEEDWALARLHFARCPNCRRAVEEWERLGQLIRESVRTIEEMKGETVREPFRGRAPVTEVAVTAVLSAVGIGFSVHSFGAVVASFFFQLTLWLSGAGPFWEVLRDIAKGLV